MDFAVCPACKQSVLDDDAVNCPFCGASMSGKPGAPAAAPPKPAATPAAKPAGKPGAKPAASDDLPFDPQANIPQSAVAASLTQTKSRSLAVTCPMCETVGYVPPTAAGKTVKCANPKCLVPIFNAPSAEPVAPPPPPKPKNNVVVLGLATTVIVAGLGAAAFFIFGRPSLTPPPSGGGGLLTEEDLKKQREQRQAEELANGTTSDAVVTPTPGTAKTTDTPAPAAGSSGSELIAAALKQSADISLSNTRNRSKPYCRRLSAEAHAIAGQLDKALGEIEQLTKVGADLPFYRIGPWVEVFWQAQAQGDAARAATALDSALVDTAKLPKRGRDQMDVATKLAAALVVAGRDEDARKLIGEHQASDLDGIVSYWLMWIAADRDLKDPAALIATQPVIPRQFPQAAAISAVVTLHGQPELARKFALGWTDADAKLEAVAAWAEALVWSQPPAEAAKAINSGVADLPPMAAAFVQVRAARSAAAVGDDAVAKQLLGRAQSALEERKTPDNFVVPSRESLVKTRPKFDEDDRRAAVVAAEIAVAPKSLGHDAAAALDKALQFARGLGPSLPAAGKLAAEADRADLRNVLKQELKLRTDDDARQAANEFRRHATLLEEGARRRFQLQSTLMSRAAQLGLAEQTWLIASTKSVEADENLQEPYLQPEPTNFAGWLIESFKASKQVDLEKAALAAIGPKAPPRPTPAVFREAVAAGEAAKAWATVSQPGVGSDLQEALLLEAVVQQAAKSPPTGAWSLIGQLSSKPVLREQGQEWASLIAARNGHGAEVAKQIPNITQTTEIVSANRGLVAGLVDADATK